jgi:hypothetical protein
MPGVTLISFFEIVQFLGTSLAVYRLVETGLFRRYRWFFAYLVFRLPVIPCVLFLDKKSDAYFYFWIFITPVSWALYILVFRELYGLILVRHRGIQTLGRWAMYLGIATSITLSVLSLIPRFTVATPQKSRIIGYFYAIDRGVVLSLSILLLVMLLLLSQYLSVLSRNLVAHAVLFAVLFLSDTIGSILRSVFGVQQFPAIETPRMGVWAACSMAWFFVLSRKGEMARDVLPSLGQKHEKRVLSQLDALNAALLNVGRK